MPLYTFFLDYQGGTYISQARAPSRGKALVAWGQKIVDVNIPGLGTKSKAKLVQRILEDELETPVKNIENTWCRAAVVRGSTAFLHYTLTVGR